MYIYIYITHIYIYIYVHIYIYVYIYAYIYIYICIGRETMLDRMPQMFKREKDEAAAEHRWVFAFMRVVCYHGEATFLRRQGVLPGDTHAVECFRRAFTNVTVSWQAERLTHASHTTLLTTTSPSGKRVYLGVTNYAHDTAEQKHVSWQKGSRKGRLKERCLTTKRKIYQHKNNKAHGQ